MGSLIIGIILIFVFALILTTYFNFTDQSRIFSNNDFVKAQYASHPKTTEGDWDATELIRLLKSSNSNTYNFIVTDHKEDFNYLEVLLPKAKENGIDIWVTLLPPSGLKEEQRNDMEYIDYLGMARKLARLSLQYDNLKAWSIDNVIIDRDFFGVGYLEEITGVSKEINNDLEFIPVVYYSNIDSTQFDEKSKFFDGVQFYFTHFPTGESNESVVLLPQLKSLKEKFDGKVILGIYATPWSKDRPTTANYIDQLIKLAKEDCNGVMIYTLQKEGAKLEVIKKHFS